MGTTCNPWDWPKYQTICTSLPSDCWPPYPQAWHPDGCEVGKVLTHKSADRYSVRRNLHRDYTQLKNPRMNGGFLYLEFLGFWDGMFRFSLRNSHPKKQELGSWWSTAAMLLSKVSTCAFWSWLHSFFAIFPVSWANFAVLFVEFKGVNHAQHFFYATA